MAGCDGGVVVPGGDGNGDDEGNGDGGNVDDGSGDEEGNGDAAAGDDGPLAGFRSAVQAPASPSVSNPAAMRPARENMR
ncbi:hypothetical protein AB0F88_12490 [Streptosporangium sp. NPDC023963]|uniref:hypothetical protein n=1 Tax=Streptosporangium sp. NPDC023963 TaxID=3155608 RepID=UPI003421BB02